MFIRKEKKNPTSFRAGGKALSARFLRQSFSFPYKKREFGIIIYPRVEVIVCCCRITVSQSY